MSPPPITPEMLATGSEDGEQKALFCWAAQSNIPELRWMFHIPNGGSRHIAEAAKLKAMGVKPGVPDLFLPIPKGQYLGLFIELKKVKGGVVTDEQKQWHIMLNCINYRCEVCPGWLFARETILWYLKQ